MPKGRAKKVVKVAKSRAKKPKEKRLKVLKQHPNADLYRREVFINKMVESGVLRYAAQAAQYNEDYAGTLLGKPEIREEILRRQKLVAERSVVSAAEIVGELAKVARHNGADFVPPQGMTLDLDFLRTLPRDVMAAVSGMDCETDWKGTTKVKLRFYNKVDAEKEILRIMGMGEKPSPLQDIMNYVDPSQQALFQDMMREEALAMQQRMLPGVKVVEPTVNGEHTCTTSAPDA